MNHLGVSMLASGWLVACSQAGPAVELASPRALGPTEVDQGRALYLDYGCVLCHGPEGKGGVANLNSETGGKIPGLVYVKEGYTPAQLVAKLLDGVSVVGKENREGPVPPFRMLAYRSFVSPAEQKALVAYLISLYPEGEEESWGEKN